LATDAVLILCQNVASGLVVYPKVIAAHLQAELPFMATENILMLAVRAGGDRQALHERIRVHSLGAAERVKAGDGVNDLMERIRADGAFASVRERLEEALEPSAFVGRAPAQVDEFLDEVAVPALADLPADEDAAGEPRV
jgi:adenylosuccinate lyase